MRSESGPDRRTIWTVRLGTWVIRVLAWTWRVTVVHDDAVRAMRGARKPIIFALWHGQMLPLLLQHRGEGVAVLISEHGDGELIAGIDHNRGAFVHDGAQRTQDRER